MKPWKEQQGMTLVGWLMVLVLAGAAALLVLKVVPVYLESFKVEGAIKAVVEEPGVAEMNKRQIYKKFISRMDVDDVDRFTERNIHKFMTVQKQGPKVTLTLKYQNVTHLIHNISLQFDFKHQASNR